MLVYSFFLQDKDNKKAVKIQKEREEISDQKTEMDLASSFNRDGNATKKDAPVS